MFTRLLVKSRSVVGCFSSPSKKTTVTTPDCYSPFSSPVFGIRIHNQTNHNNKNLKYQTTEAAIQKQQLMTKSTTTTQSTKRTTGHNTCTTETTSMKSPGIVVPSSGNNGTSIDNIRRYNSSSNQDVSSHNNQMSNNNNSQTGDRYNQQELTTTKRLPSFVKIVEVGPRDGLQGEPVLIPTPVKINFINLLSSSGLKVIEVTSFVHPVMVPQMGDNFPVFSGIKKHSGVNYPVLVPNLTGLTDAIKAGSNEIAVFAAATDSFSMKNVNCNISTSLEKISQVISTAISHGVKVRGYISCCLGCPYDGEVPPEKVAKIAFRLYSMGCYEISLGDTIGIGTPESMKRLLIEVSKYIPIESIAVHCHDTYGQALANILTALEMGISVVDSSVTGLGGCPFAEGATGNVATEDVLYMLNGMGIKTGVDMDKLIEAGNYICDHLKRETGSKAGRALIAKKRLSLKRQSSNGSNGHDGDTGKNGTESNGIKNGEIKSTNGKVEVKVKKDTTSEHAQIPLKTSTRTLTRSITRAATEIVCQSNKPGHKNIQ